jgi:hypothetical protein
MQDAGEEPPPMAMIPHTPMSPGSQAVYDSLINDLDNASDIRLESILESQATIAKFERLYGMSSSEMRRNLHNGDIEETFDICRWSQEISFLDLLLVNRR